MMKFLALLALALPTAAVAQSETAPPASTEQSHQQHADQGASNGERLICRYEEDSASRMGRRRVCRTQEQWRNQRD